MKKINEKLQIHFKTNKQKNQKQQKVGDGSQQHNNTEFSIRQC